MQKNKTFHQIFFSLQPGEQLPVDLRAVSESSRHHFADFDYRLWDLTTVRQLIHEGFGTRVLAAFDGLKPLAFKADLARYCLIYQFGGWYCDLSVQIRRSIPLNSAIQMFYFHDFGLGPPAPSSFLAACQNGFFFAQAGHPVLGDCIQTVVNNVEKRFYGLNSTCPTGPMVFGKAVLKYAPDPSMIPGYFMALTPQHVQKNFSYVTPTGDIVAFHKSTWHQARPMGGDMKSLGLKGSNNYNRMWEQRDIYC